MFELLAELVPAVGVAEKVFDNVKAIVDCFPVFKRKKDPSAQHASAHRTDCAVKHTQKAFATFVEGVDKFEISHRKTVESNVSALFNA